MRSEPPESLPCASGTTPAATAAADAPLEPPGLRVVSHGFARRAVQHRLGRRHQGELGRRGGADDHQAGRAVAAHELGVGGRDVVAQERRSLGVADAGDRRQVVLDEHRRAGERPGRGPRRDRSRRAASSARSKSGSTRKPSTGSRRSARSIAASVSSVAVSYALAHQRGLRDRVGARQIDHPTSSQQTVREPAYGPQGQTNDVPYVEAVPGGAPGRVPDDRRRC